MLSDDLAIPEHRGDRAGEPALFDVALDRGRKPVETVGRHADGLGGRHREFLSNQWDGRDHQEQSCGSPELSARPHGSPR